MNVPKQTICRHILNTDYLLNWNNKYNLIGLLFPVTITSKNGNLPTYHFLSMRYVINLNGKRIKPKSPFQKNPYPILSRVYPKYFPKSFQKFNFSFEDFFFIMSFSFNNDMTVQGRGASSLLTKM